MKIGKLQLEVKPPADLDAALLALAGVNGAEMAVLLASPCIASTVATAITPFAPGAPDRPVLAAAIADAGVDPVRAETAAIYAKYLKGKANAAKEG